MKNKALIITRVYDLLLQTVYQYRFLTSLQATTLLYQPGMLTTVRARLKTLADYQYLLSLQLPTTRGQSPLVYTLARRGITYLAAQGMQVRERFRPVEDQEKSYAFLSHALKINDVLIAAAKLPTVNPAIQIAQIRHEHDLKHTPIIVPPGSAKTGGGRSKTIIPDAWLDIRIALGNKKTRRFTLWLELDRGTIEAKQFKRKVQAIATIMQAGVYETVFQAKVAQVAFVTTAGKKRMEQMRTWTREACSSSLELAKTLFRFTALPEVIDPLVVFCTPVWYTAFAEREPVALLGR